jgi:predicted GNAT family N-acyltransferase
MAEFLIAVAVRDTSARQSLLARLDELNAQSALATRLQCGSLKIETYGGTRLHEDVEAAERALSDFYGTVVSGRAILISDSLVDERKPAEVVLHLADQFLGKAFGTVGIHARGARVPEIDRILKPDAPTEQVRDALELIAARLSYVTPPVRSQRKAEFQIRRIRDEFELKKCFCLRHRIYTIMGYLDDRKENVPSRMEIDALDEVAMHFGAFYRNQGYDTLAGTFRVVLVNQPTMSFTEWTRKLLDSDPQLRTLVRSESYPLRLPVFQSQQLDDHLQESIQRRLNCAELSRVIVAEEYRGMGLANRLVERSQQEARNLQVHRFYLECLRQHEALYAKLGFQTIPGKAGRVIGVNRTMIPMRQQFEVAAAVATTAVTVP